MAFDIKKEINEMKYYLSNKLKSSIENKDKAKNKIKSKTKGKDKLLINKIHTLWTKYYAKFYKTLNIPDKEQALIKMYSNYKALKVIGNVCKEILDETNDGKKVLSDEEIREYMGALDVAKLAKEQKKFLLRAKHKKFSIKDGEAKVAEILNARKKMQADTLTKNPKSYKVLTPFGEITISCEFNDDGKTIQTRMIRLPGQTNNEPYTEMAKLDNALNKLDISVRKALIERIEDYINQKVQFNENDDANVLLQKINPSTFTGFDNLEEKVKNEAKNAAAILCGCLLFAESSEVRNPTRGKLEKKAIKKVGRLIEQECTNPFGVVFANESPCYYDDTFYSRKEPTSIYTPAKSKPKRNSNTRTVPPYHKGGQYQTEWLITGKATIMRDILPANLHKNYKDISDDFSTISTATIKDNKFCANNFELGLLNVDKVKTAKATLDENIANRCFNSTKTSLGTIFQNMGKEKQKLFKILSNTDRINKHPINDLINLYLHSDKLRTKIKIKNIPDNLNPNNTASVNLKNTRNHMLNSIKENRKNLHELNKK